LTSAFPCLVGQSLDELGTAAAGDLHRKASIPDFDFDEAFVVASTDFAFFGYVVVRLAGEIAFVAEHWNWYSSSLRRKRMLVAAPQSPLRKFQRPYLQSQVDHSSLDALILWVAKTESEY
jgi:hypothetical protein